MSKQGLFLRAAAVLVLLTLASRVLGFVRQILIANEFGLSWETDAYFFALMVPTAVFVIVPGAVNAVVIPTLKGLMGEGDLRERQRLFRLLATWLFLVFAVIAAAGIWGASAIVRFLAPAFSPEKQALTADMLQIMLPSIVMIGFISIMTAFLHAHDDFFQAALGPVFNNLLVIVSIYTLAPLFGMRGIAWGTLLGYVLFALFLVRPLVRRKYSFRPAWRPEGNKYMKGMGERFVPIMLGLFISQIYMFMEKVLAGTLGDQKLSALALAMSVVQMPIAIFSGALTVPLFPLLSEYVKRNRIDQMKETLAKGFLYQYHIMLPCTVGLALLSVPVIDLLFNHGAAFTRDDTLLVARALFFYSLGMVAWAGRDLVTRASYALEDTKTPVAVAAVSVVIYLGLAFLLMPYLDYVGLPIAYVSSVFFNMLAQMWLIRRRIGKLFGRGFYLSLGKGLAAAAAMTVLLYGFDVWFGAEGLLRLLVVVPLAAAVYFGMLIGMKEALADEWIGKITRGRIRIGRWRNWN